MSDRELDAKVATEVMGMKKFVHDKVTHFENEEYLWRDWEVPYYSTDIAAAMLVVEKMREKGHHVGIETVYMGFRCEIGGGIKVIADTLPLAICRAAVMAVEAE